MHMRTMCAAASGGIMRFLLWRGGMRYAFQRAFGGRHALADHRCPRAGGIFHDWRFAGDQ